MTIKTLDSLSGQLRDASAVAAADRLLDMRQSKSFWEVCDEVVKIWYQKEPRAYRAYIINLNIIRETRKDRKYGTASKKDYNQLRYTVDCPEFIVLILRKLYSVDEMDLTSRKFWHKFAERYPIFRVPDKL